MKITELKGEAYAKAIAEEIKAEWDDETDFTEEDVIAFSLRMGTIYDKNGNFVGYEGVKNE